MSTPLSARDRILQAAMGLFVERGFAATTTLEIATRARVSKRELYALVGNKDEMLALCIARRGNRMRLPEGFPEPTDRASLEAALRKYGATLLCEITQPAVLETFRLGIAEAKRSPAIARTLSERGREPARFALEALLTSARAAKLLADGNMDEMLHDFGALLWGNTMVWILLGLEKAPGPKEIERRAERAARRFLELYGR
ncbi:MAG TPA: TetR/AcrR family transcriptional regulator [Casimicrobiaceae bacterium]|nr:TetR/AcrR family transcriptional regulator [Casimicrobiaceae bacterium]